MWKTKDSYIDKIIIFISKENILDILYSLYVLSRKFRLRFFII